ncbi:MAG: 3-phosphoshikimate 1-carboxyvinyltransferase [Mariprofundaceae bacterium]
MNKTLVAGPIKSSFQGVLTIPGDKSMSHRAIMLASLADGTTSIKGFLPGDDNLATAQMFIDMGVKIAWLNKSKTELQVHGVGLRGLQEPTNCLDAGNSGTCVRLMTGVLAAQPFFSVMVGDNSLHKRPMQRIVEPMLQMGASIDGRDHGKLLPLTIRGGNLHSIHHRSKVASAQIKSCVMLAALFADGESRISEPRPTRDHTERMLPLFGQPVDFEGDSIVIKPTGTLQAPHDTVHIPADPSSAAFFAVAASLFPESNITLPAIGMNPRRDGWQRILNGMGAHISLQQQRNVGKEVIADLNIRYADNLHGITVSPADVPDAIDEFPILFVAAALSKGEFILSGAEELRVKESDRIAAMATALAACGANVEERSDGIRIVGCERLAGGVTIDAHGDHRIAMAMAVAAQRADAEITILHAGEIMTSFPDFINLAQQGGMNLHWDDR